MEDDLKAEYPWPRLGDVLFTAGKDWWYNACVNYGSDQWHLCAQGYRRAAERIFQSLSERTTDQDFIVYPLIFLWRQHIELMLKALIRLGNLLDDKSDAHPKTDGYPWGHMITSLWQECRPILEEWPGETGDLDAVQVIITEFAAVDPQAETFRYPTNREGASTLNISQRLINLRNFHEVMVRVANFLESAELMMEAEQDTRQEMANYFDWPE